MRDTCATVRVVAPVTDENPHGHITINASDLTDGHRLFDAEQVEAADKSAAKRLRKAAATENKE
jgi:hypothetical protein